MKICDAIAEVDAQKINTYSLEQKIKWLNRLDSRIYNEIICTHRYNDGEPEVTFDGYDLTDEETELIVGEPYAEMYVRWLEAQMDYNNMEYDAFNNCNAMFESIFRSFRNAYNQSHRPVGCAKKYF